MPVYIGKSWPIIAAVIVFTFGPSIADNRPELGLSAYFVALVFAVLLLISVLAHEAAHAVVATRVGYRVNRVVADLWGGHTAYDSSSARPGPSALVAIAGPAANALLAGIGWLAMPAVPPGGITDLLVSAVVYTNAFVAAFNLLPGLPLDGGFLVDSLVWKITGSRETGMIAAGWCGRVVTILVMLWFLGLPLLNGQPPDLFSVVWGLLIGSFLWVGATNAIRAGRGSRLLNGIRIDAVWRPAASLPPQASAAEAFALRSSGPEGSGGTIVVVEDDARNAIGLLDDEALLAIPEQSRGGVVITSVMRPQPDGDQSKPYNEILRGAAARVKAMREMLGPDVDIGCDIHARFFEVTRAARLAAVIAPYNPMWLEEPIRPENEHAMKMLADRVTIPLASGECNYQRHEFRRLLELGALDIIQPDICLCGGLMEMKKIAAMAEAHYVTVAPHNPMGPVATAVNVHFAASTSNFFILEYHPDDEGVRKDVLKEPLMVKNGYIPLPTKPGLGVELNEDAIRKYPAVTWHRGFAYREDGSVGYI